MHDKKNLCIGWTALPPAAFMILSLGFLFPACRRAEPLPPLSFQPGDLACFVPVREKVVALTYDDGPNEPYTTDLLNVLKDGGATATFFLVGKNVEAFPRVAARIKEEGHAIGNHTYGHENLADVTDAQVVAEIELGEKAIEKATGVLPKLFRAPYGSNTRSVARVCHDRGEVMVGWSCAGSDWNSLPADRIAELILGSVQPGSIILLHDGEGIHLGTSREATVDATRTIIRELKTRGYRTVTIPELFRLYSSSPSEIEFGNGLRFLGMASEPETVPRGDAFYNRCYFYRPYGAPVDGAAVFIHFIGPRGAVFQDDHVLGDFMGTENRVVHVPVTIPEGPYAVQLGLYRPDAGHTAARLDMRTQLPVHKRAAAVPAALHVKGMSQQ